MASKSRFVPSSWELSYIQMLVQDTLRTADKGGISVVRLMDMWLQLDTLDKLGVSLEILKCINLRHPAEFENAIHCF